MPPRRTARTVVYLLLAALAGCSSQTLDGGTGGSGAGTGGSPGSGGTGATGTGGAGTGGSATGGSGTGGVGTGGSGTGGKGTGGIATGGSAGSSAGSGGAAGGRGGQGGKAGAPGSGGGGGALGSGGSTGSGGSGSSACPYKLCEDFESGTAGGLPTGWTTLAGYGSSTGIGLANDAAHGGSMSLKSNSMTPGQGRAQKSLSSLGAIATKHWGRIFYKVQSPAPKPSSGNVIHVTLTALEGPNMSTSASSNFENRIVDTVEDSNGKHQWIYNVPDDSCCTGSTYDWMFDASWHCAEWYVDQSTESYRFFSDGTEVTQIGFTNNSNAKMMAWTNIAVGAIFYQQPPSAFVIWFDDLAINDTQIGCK
jgi:hypothetical protein